MQPTPTDLPRVLVIADDDDLAGVRDLLATIDRGMADPAPGLDVTRAGYPSEWASLAPRLTRAHHRAMRKAERAPTRAKSAP